MGDNQNSTHPPRKNLRGFACHIRALVNRLVREEFPELAPVQVCLYGPKDALAQWNEWVLLDGRVLRCVSLCAAGSRETRPFYLNADDEELRVILRHELIHGEMKRRGQPWGDRDFPFILECLRRRTIVNPDSVRALESIYGRGSFETFQTFLPPAETVTILLPESAGVWLRKTGR